MANPFRIFLAIFTAYRLASLIASEEGPYLPFLYKDSQETGIFEWIRSRLGVYNYGPDGQPTTNLARGIRCPLCVGVYLSFCLSILARPKNPVEFFLVWFGISGAQVFLENLTSDDAIQEAIEEVAESMDDHA